jgi:hypothetical protein
MMVYKVLLVVPIVYLTIQDMMLEVAIYGVAALAIQAAILYLTAPFVDPLDDFMDLSGRIAGLVAAIGGAVNNLNFESSGLNNGVGVIVIISNTLNCIIMVAIIGYGFKKVKNIIKNTRGSFLFLNSCSNISDLKAEVALKQWDLDREIKHRICKLIITKFL